LDRADGLIIHLESEWDSILIKIPDAAARSIIGKRVRKLIYVYVFFIVAFAGALTSRARE